MIFLVLPRYRLFIEPFVILLAMYGLVEKAKTYKKGAARCIS